MKHDMKIQMKASKTLQQLNMHFPYSLPRHYEDIYDDNVSQYIASHMYIESEFH